jgi:hypothetical protein
MIVHKLQYERPETTPPTKLGAQRARDDEARSEARITAPTDQAEIHVLLTHIYSAFIYVALALKQIKICFLACLK